ncbi:hypothetical protein E1B22_05555 [Thermaerobacter sp. FW80]|uniref:nucleotidyl transferase AbiEii/AbiGii toxin family protein n=1 Tax=Thermaerobacter sp. FW80 TaxID=2546351 RepID=UPI001074EB61|nr:nucleotidyl transferase AbiEii/AbiGii toxin family protein [Thermaerobacter sp. FW80]QBS37383.1 hypothetical protein E1B22_05555 [Thermaerobacter sp. FW80]
MHWELLSDDMRTVLLRLREAGLCEGFYLTGGTALALHLGHRRSVDLDFFTRRPQRTIRAAVLQKACSRVFDASEMRLILREADQVWFELRGVKTTFLAYPFPRVRRLHHAEGIAIAAVQDIALQKAYAIGRRATARDYVDLAYILHSGAVSLEQIVHDARRVFVLDGEPVFSVRSFLSQLVYDADLPDKDVAVSLLRRREDFASIMALLREEVRRTTPHLLGFADDLAAQDH